MKRNTMKNCTYAAGVGIANRYDALVLDDLVDPLDAINNTGKNKTKKIKPKKLDKPKQPITTESRAKPEEQTQTKAADLPQGISRIRSNNKASIDKSLVNPTKPITDKPVGKASFGADTEKAFLKQVPPSQQLTLDEYREVSAAHSRPRKMPNYNLRQPNEGEDVSQWENLVLLVKKKHGEVKKVEEVNEYETLESQRVGRQKRLPVSVTFGDNARGLRRERMVARSMLSVSPESIRYQPPPHVDNEKEFPSLGQ